MRIIGGQFGSRLISMPKGVEIRPTQDRVREAIFNILGDISGRSCLDLFAGTGAFGIEAISRGAEHVTFVDNNPICIRTIIANLKSLGIDNGSYDVIKYDALKYCSIPEPGAPKYDIVFADPPYYKELAKKSLISIDSYDIVSRVGLVLVEHFKKDVIPTGLKTLIFEDERRYGDTIITIFRRAYDKEQDSRIPRDV